MQDSSKDLYKDDIKDGSVTVHKVNSTHTLLGLASNQGGVNSKKSVESNKITPLKVRGNDMNM